MAMSLAGDAKWEALLAKGADWYTGSPSDALASPLHGSLDGGSPPLGSVAQVTSAVVAGGAYVEAITWGVALAQHIEKVTGNPMLFLSEMSGTFGGVRWIGVSADAAGADAAGQKMVGDTTYLDMLSSIGDLFLPGSGHQSTVMRVA